MQKVFIPLIPHRWDAVANAHRPVVDVSDAISYGESATLIPFSHLNNLRLTSDVQGLIDDIKFGMIDSTKEDYVLAVGDPALIAAAIAVQAKKFNYARMLRWDRETSKYRVVEMKL